MPRPSSHSRTHQPAARRPGEVDDTETSSPGIMARLGGIISSVLIFIGYIFYLYMAWTILCFVLVTIANGCSLAWHSITSSPQSSEAPQPLEPVVPIQLPQPLPSLLCDIFSQLSHIQSIPIIDDHHFEPIEELSTLTRGEYNRILSEVYFEAEYNRILSEVYFEAEYNRILRRLRRGDADKSPAMPPWEVEIPTQRKAEIPTQWTPTSRDVAWLAVYNDVWEKGWDTSRALLTAWISLNKTMLSLPQEWGMWWDWVVTVSEPQGSEAQDKLLSNRFDFYRHSGISGPPKGRCYFDNWFSEESWCVLEELGLDIQNCTSNSGKSTLIPLVRTGLLIDRFTYSVRQASCLLTLLTRGLLSNLEDVLFRESHDREQVVPPLKVHCIHGPSFSLQLTWTLQQPPVECEPYILPQELDKFIEPLSTSLDLHRQLDEYRHANRGLMSKAIKWAAKKRGRQTPEDLLKEKLGDQSPSMQRMLPKNMEKLLGAIKRARGYVAQMDGMIKSLANIQDRVSTAIGLLNGGPKPRAHECLVADTSLSLGLDYPTVDVPPVTVEARHVEAWWRQLEQFRRQVKQGLEHRDWYSTFLGENKTRQWSYPGQEV
ncbi:hypothetical protein FDECE_4135 [Fusarium decemcellulare]|nr:hypothetical protein FDECE_4135 [Fusarium decemcellulare]